MVTWKPPHSQISVLKLYPIKIVKLLTLHADLILALFLSQKKKVLTAKAEG